jgi:nucleoside-diphosphate-sugar epimerase
MRIFVTGSSGFIGSELCRQAETAGHEILRLESPHRLDAPPLELLASFKPEVAVHCAWITTPGVYTESPENAVLRQQSLEMFRALSANGIQHFVGCGTCAEYAPSELDLDEDSSATGPSSPYARAKHSLHSDLRKAASESSVTLSWARIFFPYGPGEHPDRLVSALFRAFQAGRREHLWCPSAVRDYVHVQDVASGLLACALSHADGCYNIGTGHGVSLGQLEAEVARVCGRSDLVAGATCDSPGRTEDCFVASTGKLLGLGWMPRITLSDGLAGYRHNVSN